MAVVATVAELAAVQARMRRLSYWSGVFAVPAAELPWPEGGGRPAVPTAGQVVAEGPWFAVLAAFWARMRGEARWDTGRRNDGPEDVGFRVVGRDEAWAEVSRGVMAFGPVEGRSRRLAELRGEMRRALTALGHHRQPRDGFVAFRPLWRRGEVWTTAIPAACAVADTMVVVTPQVAACLFTGDDD